MTYEITITNTQSQSGNIAFFQKAPNVGSYQTIAWKVQPPGSAPIGWKPDYGIDPNYYSPSLTVAEKPPQQGLAGGITYDANGNIQLLDIQIGSSFWLKPE
ncbi:MAG: hypothetical protein DI528_07745 [Shinella sp.]|nr:MAG: hypothetical protein DI528_07745 [Shinella sp.]